MIIDSAVILVLLISAIIALLRGFIREVLTIVNVTGGMAAAYFWGPDMTPVVAGWLDAEEAEEEGRKLFDVVPYDILATFLAYGLIFIVIVVILSVISHYISAAVKSMGLGAIDRTLGVMFGLVRGLLLVGILYLPVDLYAKDDAKERWFEGSHTWPLLEGTSGWIAQFVPEDMKNFDPVKESTDDDGETSDKEKNTREMLEKMNILPSRATEQEEKPAAETNDSAEDESLSEGYKDSARTGLDQLIEEQSE